MATVMITVSDLSIAEDTFKVDFNATGEELGQGHATAAYFVGYYLHSLVNTPEFTNGVADYGRELIAAMNEKGSFPAPMRPATVTLTLEDVDLDTGRFDANIAYHGGDPKGEHLPSIAQIVGTYMRNLISSAEFQLACWKFADEFVAEHSGRHIANLDFAPDDVRAA